MAMPSRRGWLLCLLLFFATALSFLDRQVLSVLAPTITAQFHMTNTVYSRVVFAFALSYTVMFSVGGHLIDVVGTRRGLAIAVLIWTTASGLHCLATGALSLAAARFFLGIGEGACFPAVTKGEVEWFPLERRALAEGLANGGSAFGAVLAPPLTAWITSNFGWRAAFSCTAVAGALWLAAWFSVDAPGSPARNVDRCRAPFGALLARSDVRRLAIARFFFDPVFFSTCIGSRSILPASAACLWLPSAH